MIHPLRLMSLQREIRRARPQTPYLDRAIQTRRSKSIGVLRIDRQAHNIMAVPFEDLHALPTFVPVPQLDCHVIAGGQHEGLGGVHDDCAYVVGVCFEGGDLLAGVVVVDAELEVIAAADDPVLAGDEATCSHGDVGEFEGLDDGLGFVGPDVDMAAVEGGEDLALPYQHLSAFSLSTSAYPWFCWVEVYALDPLAPREELPLQVEIDLSHVVM